MMSISALVFDLANTMEKGLLRKCEVHLDLNPILISSFLKEQEKISLDWNCHTETQDLDVCIIINKAIGS